MPGLSPVPANTATFPALLSTLGRDVGLVTRRAVEQSENYIQRKSILSNLEVIYAAR